MATGELFQNFNASECLENILYALAISAMLCMLCAASTLSMHGQSYNKW